MILDRGDAARLSVVIVAAALLRAVWAAYADPVPISDFATYRSMAESLRDTLSLPARAYRLPGLPAYLALFMLISKKAYWLMTATIVLNTAITVPLYIFVLKVSGSRRAAFLGALLWAIQPNQVFFSGVLASEHLFGLMVISSFAVLVSISMKTWLRTILSGLFIGIAALTRGQGGYYLPVIMVGMFIYSTGNVRRRAFFSVSAGLATVLVMTPWIVRNRTISDGQVTMSALSGVSFYLRHSEDGPFWRDITKTPIYGKSDAEINRIAFREGIRFIKEQPLKDIMFTVQTTKALYTWSNYGLNWSTRIKGPPGAETKYTYKEVRFRKALEIMGSGAWLFTFILGLSSLLFFRRLDRRGWVIIGFALFQNWFGNAVIFAAASRYRFMAEIIFCALAGLALSRILRKQGSKRLSAGGDTF